MTEHLSEDETLAAVPPLTRTRLTAWVEVTSSGLSRQIQPEIASPLRLRAIG